MRTFAQSLNPYNLLSVQLPPYALYRVIRKDPTISLVRTLINAAVVSAPWTVERDDDVSDDQLKLIQDEMDQHRDVLVERAVLSGIDFGWQAWELVWNMSDGRTAQLDKAKPLLQDITLLETDERGTLASFVQRNMGGQEIVLPAEDHLHIAWRTEGSNWYGEPLLVNVAEVFQEWASVSAAALRFDLKIAGSQLIVRYPSNEPTTMDANGVVRPTGEVAREIGDKLAAGGVAVIQSSAVAQELSGLQDQSPDWSIDILDTKMTDPLYVERLTYLDRLKVRAMGFPERAVLEAAASGSRADSLTAAGFAIRNLEMMHRTICRELNHQLINKMLVLNYGPEAQNKIRLSPGPLLEAHRAELVELATEVVRLRPETVDIGNLLDAIDIPKAQEVVLTDAATATVPPVKEPVNG